jgi:hypothetical protein
MIRCRLHWHAFGVKLKGRTDATFAVVHSPGFAVSSIIMGFAVAMVVRQDTKIFVHIDLACLSVFLMLGDWAAVWIAISHV